MKKVNLIIVFLAVFALVYSSCGKYEEGPSLSLRTKTSRLIGVWKLVELTSNGQVQEIGEESMIYEFIKGGAFKLTGKIMGINFSADGEWQFDDSKEKVEIRLKQGNVWGEWSKYEILRLTNSELWLKDQYTEDEESFVDIYKFEKQ